MGILTYLFKRSNFVFMKRICSGSYTYSTVFISRFVGSLYLDLPATNKNKCNSLLQVPFNSKALHVLPFNVYYYRSFYTNSVLMLSNVRSIHENPRNQQIKAKSVLLIDSEGEKMGTMPLADALSKAKEKSLHLVEIQYQRGLSPAVCKLVSSRTIYESQKKAKHSSQGSKVKELRHKTCSGNPRRYTIFWNMDTL